MIPPLIKTNKQTKTQNAEQNYDLVCLKMKCLVCLKISLPVYLFGCWPGSLGLVSIEVKRVCLVSFYGLTSGLRKEVYKYGFPPLSESRTFLGNLL